MAGRQVVVDDNLVPGLTKALDGVAADIAGATRDQDHVATSFAQWSNT